MSADDANLIGKQFLEGVFEKLGLGVDVRFSGTHAEALVFELNGDLTVLNRSPHLVSSLTLLTSQSVSKALKERVNCVLDVGGNMEAKREILATAAADVSRAVQFTGRLAVFDRLTSSERRVIHTELRDDDAVETRSEGDERGRLLIVERKN